MFSQSSRAIFYLLSIRISIIYETETTLHHTVRLACDRDRRTKMAVGKEDVEIVKARTDKRNYKRILLRNSLQVLLISDPDTDKVHFYSVFAFFHFDSLTLSNFNLIRSNDYHYGSLYDFNFLFLFLLKCAASMNVDVGYFSDPAGLEGLAHFLGVLSLRMLLDFIFF